jgi:DNA-directed RNA polymerase subunit RPC12/RpoP
MDFTLTLMPLIPFLFFFAFLFLHARGINCPSCHSPMPVFQSPFNKTRRQWLVGGYRCPNCGCETDLKGRQVAARTLPEQGTLLLGLGLFVFCIVISLLLTCIPLMMLLMRN